MFPLGMLKGTPGSSQKYRNLTELVKWIPHLKSLSVDCVLLGPVFQSLDHGYDVVNQKQVDSRIGSNQDLKELIEKFHAEGIRVVLDAVFNHTSRSHFAYRSLIDKRQNSPYKGWYQNIKWDHTNSYGDPFCVDCWDGHASLPKLNVLNHEVWNEIQDTVNLWMDEFKVDGLRLDAADVIDMEFLGRLSDYCHCKNKNFWLMGEVVHGDYRQWLERGGLDSVTHYEGYKSLWSSFNDLNFFEIAYSLDRTSSSDKGIYRDYNLYLFNENHDVSRLASVLKDYNHIYALHLMHYTFPGIPSLYYGEEFGMKALKRNGDDWNLRPAMNSFFPDGYGDVKLYEEICKYARLRLEHPCLRYGGYKQIYLQSKQFAYLRTNEEETLLIVVNSDSNPIRVTMDIPGYKMAFGSLLQCPDNGIDVSNGKLSMDLSGYESAVFQLIA
jgi:glycosidase